VPKSPKRRLYEALATDTGVLKAAAIHTLARIPQAESVEDDSRRAHVDQLLAVLDRERDEYAKAEVVKALGALQHPAAVMQLIQLLDHPNYLCVVAASVLQRIGDERTIEPLIQVLRDDHRFWVPRGAAAVALGHFGPSARTALPILQEALSYRAEGDTWNDRAQEAVSDAIQHLSDPKTPRLLQGKGYLYEMWGLY
jgi:HEAT repeat protein